MGDTDDTDGILLGNAMPLTTELFEVKAPMLSYALPTLK